MRIASTKMSKNGTVSISVEARKDFGLEAGDTLLQITTPHCVILVPQQIAVQCIMNQIGDETKIAEIREKLEG